MPQVSPTEQLIADLLDSGGVLRVPYWRREGEPDYRQRVLAAQRFGKVPAGKRLVTDYIGGDLEIRLEDALAIAARVSPQGPWELLCADGHSRNCRR